ncbi:MAG: InlB B-repeat-containing protein [Clostridiales bacterium]|nr:InlB B-repeat-containing protein [Clostridiales bacterium]
MTKKFKFASVAVAVVSTAALGIAACDELPDGIEDLIPDGTTSVQTVTFDANGGAYADGVTTPVTLKTGEDGKLTAFPTTNPTHASTETHNYAFAGWTLSKDTAPLLDLSYVYTKATTVYAFWNMTPVGGDQGDDENHDTTYTITFHANGGSWDGETEKTLTTNVYGSLSALPEAPTHPEDLTFKGYTIGQTDSGVYLDASALFTKDEDVYAQWGTGGDGPVTPTYPEGDGAVEGATVSTRLKLYVGNVEHTVYSNPATEEYETSIDYIDSVVLHNGDIITLTDAEGSAVQFRYKGDEAATMMDQYTLHCEPNSPVNIYVKTYTKDSRYELELWNKYDEVGYDQYGYQVGGEIPAGEMMFFLYGTVGGDEKYSPDKGYRFEPFPSDDASVIVQYAVTTTLSKGDFVKIFRYNTPEDVDAWGYNDYESTWDYGKYEDNNFQIKYNGEFTFYLKIYEDHSSVWVAYDGEGEPVPESSVYKVGEDGEEVALTLTTLSQNDKNDGIKIQFAIVETKFETGDKIYVVLDGTPVNLSIQTSSSGVVKPSGTDNKYIEIENGGTFTIYIKLYGEDTFWTVYASRAIEESEITKHAEAVTANNAYLVGNVQYSDASWDNCNDKGFKLTKKEGSLYELVMQLTSGDDVKFYLTGSSTSNKTWVGNIITPDMTDYLAVVGQNIAIKQTGYFHFLVDFSKDSVYVSFDADKEPEAPEIVEPPVTQEDCSLRGVYNGTTDWGTGWAMTAVTPTGGAKKQFEITVTINAGSKLEFKIVYKDQWINNVHGGSEVQPSKSDNLTLSNTGSSPVSYVIVLEVWNDAGNDCSIRVRNA